MRKRGRSGASLASLYRRAERGKISVFMFSAPLCRSMSVLLPGGDCAIAIDPGKLSGERDEKEKLAHELGHCETGAFYNRYSPYDLVGRSERRAEEHAIKLLVPKYALLRAVAGGTTALYELASLFDVSEDFMRKAIEYYRGK